MFILKSRDENFIRHFSCLYLKSIYAKYKYCFICNYLKVYTSIFTLILLILGVSKKHGTVLLLPKGVPYKDASKKLRRIGEKISREFQTTNMQECFISCKSEVLCIGQNIKFLPGNVFICQLITLEVAFTSQLIAFKYATVRINYS